MRRVLWLVLVAWFGAAACSLNTEATGAGSQPDAGASGGSGATGGTGGGSSNCFPSQDEKFCGGDSCPPKDDPAHGCAQSSCAACSLPNAITDCAADGTCGIQSCNPGFEDCDHDPGNGCEINKDSDPKNCGQCGNDCFTPGDSTNWVCNQGKCQVSNCPTGAGDCNHNPSDKCEVNLTNDPKNCGYCGHVCAITHATATCVNGKCTLEAGNCDQGWADCNGDPSDGCEQDIAADPNHCGSCTTVCSTANGLPACQSGSCSIGCKSGFGNCDGKVGNGCEIDLNTDAKHCGKCSTVCSTNNASSICSGGKCQLSCKADFDDCDGNTGNGCETDLKSDNQHCGNCSTSCSGGKTCQDKSCKCGASEVDYNGTCCTPETDASACGNKCNTSVTNNCGQSVSCGNCGGKDVCTSSNTCCTPQSDAAACGNKCNTSVTNNCGQSVSCGNCGGGDVCTGSNTCCTPKTCASSQCGSIGDGCGNTLDCGSCGGSETCNKNTCVCDSTHHSCGTSPLQCYANDDNNYCGDNSSCTACSNDGEQCDAASGSCCYQGNHNYDCNQGGITCCPNTSCHGNGHCY